LYINFNFGYNSDLSLPYADWNGHAEKSRWTQVFLNRLVWENGYPQVAKSPTQGDALLDVYRVRPESALTSFSNIHRIREHCGILLDVEWGENYREHQVEKKAPVYHKTNVTGLQSFLRSKFASWASNSRCVEEMWKSFKETVLRYRSFCPI